MAGEPTADDIQADIERARASLADTVDQLAYRTDPKRVARNAKAALLERAQSTQGKAVLGGVGALLVVMALRRRRKAKRRA